MIGMPTINSIRQLRRDGLSITDIASATGVSRDTVYKYLKKDDFSPQIPSKQKACVQTRSLQINNRVLA